MIKSILSLALLLSLSPMKKDEEAHQNFFEQRNGYTLAKTKKLGIQTLNHNLLNKIVFQLVNKKKTKKRTGFIGIHNSIKQGFSRISR